MNIKFSKMTSPATTNLGEFIGESEVLVKIALALVFTGIFLVTTMPAISLADSKTNQIRISYVPPEDPGLLEVSNWVTERQPLERLQEFLSPFRLPRTLEITIRGCDGEDDAFYSDYVITICYEYIKMLRDNAPTETTPAGVTPIDAIQGPFFDTSLHEFAHALFDMLKLPVLGREEDAADRVAAFIYLQLGFDESRRLIMGTAYAYLAEASKVELPLSLQDLADEHSTPAQRAFNVLCIAYGANTEMYDEFVSNGYLPEKRAMACEEDYELIQDGYEALVGPNIDLDMAKEIFKRDWLR
jgi:hypothetical protein